MEDKMFVVVLVIAVIFAGLFVYLLSLDRQTKKLEKRVEELELEKQPPTVEKK